MDAYDDLMRKKLHFQQTDYVEDGELLCFGLSEHILEEHLPTVSKKARKDLETLATWVDGREEQNLNRPAYKSTFDHAQLGLRTGIRQLLAVAIIRELPIKSFYTRAMIAYGYFTFFYFRSLSRGKHNKKPVAVFMQEWQAKTLANYPDLGRLVMFRQLAKIPISPDPHRIWRFNQQPIFHQVHRAVYRYRWRKPRYVPWDGTMSQPAMPFMQDTGSGVINGTWKRLPNNSPGAK